jgi:hypothetical protein
MAIRSLKTGAMGRSALAGNPIIIPGSYESIATVTVGAGGSSSITFSSIPSTYTHLQIRAYWGFTDTGNNTWLNTRFNSDSGTNYAYHALRGNGSTLSASTQSASNTRLSLGADDNGSATVWAASVADILDYSNTSKYKTTRALAGQDRNGAGAVNFWSGLWMSTAAITSINIYSDASTFRQNSVFALYGVI